jgi:hypothetical protein
MQYIEKPLKLNRNIPFVDAVFRVMEGTRTLSEVAAILRQAERKNKICFLTANQLNELPILTDELYDIAENELYNLLTETEMVFGSYEYSRLDLIYDGYLGLWSHRSWGATIAEWANRNQWLGKLDWYYLDFYGGLNDRIVQNYLSWSDVMMQAIAQKSAEDMIERGK